MKTKIEELTDREFESKYGLTREDVNFILWENSEAGMIWEYTHR